MTALLTRLKKTSEPDEGESHTQFVSAILRDFREYDAACSNWSFTALQDGRISKDTAFTCGMMHSVGNLLIRMFYPKEAASIDQAEAMSSSKRHTLEHGHFGYNSADVGAELAKRWKFPEIIQNAIAQQYLPENSEEYSKEAGIIYIARYLKRAHDQNLSEDEIVAGFPLQVASKVV